MHRSYLIAGALFGALAVVLGAFGAHGLQKIVSDEKLLHGFQTGVQYQMFHALALLGVGIIYEKLPYKMIKWAGIFFVTGIIFFSGSLYLLTALDNTGKSIVKIIGPFTPLGGIMLIAGWVMLLAGVMKKRER